jgi:hypothetical protein
LLSVLNYNSGYAKTYLDWIGTYSNCSFEYFARHRSGDPKQYKFNSQGYRGPDHVTDPDISIFGSSFSFGVGIEFDQCWHQHLGNYKINCYAPAGFLVTNNDIINHYNSTKPAGITILQLREFKYNTQDLDIPQDTFCFVIDEVTPIGFIGFSYNSFVDKAEDQTHPGPETHLKWAKIIKRMLNL